MTTDESTAAQAQASSPSWSGATQRFQTHFQCLLITIGSASTGMGAPQSGAIGCIDGVFGFPGNCAPERLNARKNRIWTPQAGENQSTISEAIANLEVDLNVTLFNCSQRQPALTEAGQVLGANDRFNRSANQLANGLEPRLTAVLSDTFQSKTFENMLSQVDQRYAALRFECLIAEYEDVVALVQQGRAHLGLMAAQDDYPPNVAHATLPELSEIVLCVSRNHPLASQPNVGTDALRLERELRLSTSELDDKDAAPPNATWSAPGYLMLLEMASLGFG